MSTPTYDEIDRAILSRLQQDGRIANVELAEGGVALPLVVPAPHQGAGGRRAVRTLTCK